MPHLQQLLGRIRRIGEGISDVQTFQLSRPLALGHLKHAILVALPLLLMKVREIKFLASIPAQKKSFGWSICRLGFDSLANMEVCENKNSNYQLVQSLDKKTCAEVPSAGQAVCTHPRYTTVMLLLFSIASILKRKTTQQYIRLRARHTRWVCHIFVFTATLWSR